MNTLYSVVRRKPCASTGSSGQVGVWCDAGALRSVWMCSTCVPALGAVTCARARSCAQLESPAFRLPGHGGGRGLPRQPPPCTPVGSTARPCQPGSLLCAEPTGQQAASSSVPAIWALRLFTYYTPSGVGKLPWSQRSILRPACPYSHRRSAGADPVFPLQSRGCVLCCPHADGHVRRL